MSADVINLRQARKAAKRRDKDARAAENRRLHGRTKAERLEDRRRRETTERHLDAHRLSDAEERSGTKHKAPNDGPADA